jgi:hypothetical protein
MDRQLYQDQTNVPFQKEVHFKFTVDAGNAPALAASPLNIYVTSVARVSQGLYRLTLSDAFKNHLSSRVSLNVNAAGVARWAQSGPVVLGSGATPSTTIDILIVDNAGAVQDPPAANANNFVSGVIVFCDVAAV